MASCTIINNPFIESCCVVSVEVTGDTQKTITITLENGEVITEAFTDNNTTYSMSYADGMLTFTPSVGAAVTFDILAGLVSSDAGNLIRFGSDGKLYADDVTTSIINNPDGHRIATYINENSVAFDIDETITSITGATLGADNVLTINYRNETGVSASTTVDLSTLAADVKVLSLQYDAVTNTIQITNTDGSTNSVVLTDIIDVITNTLTMTGNTLESTVNGVSDSVDVITSASLSKIGTDLVMSVNGVAASIPISSIADGSETKVNAGTNVTVTGVGSTANPYVVSSIDTNTTYTASISGNVITLTGSDGSTQTINLPAASVPDGSETKINPGTGVAITGTGTIADPYVVANTVVDTDTTYSFAVSGNNLVITDSLGASTTLAIPCACDGSETQLTAGTNVTLTGSGTTASPYVISSSAAVSVTGVAITGTDTKTITISLSDGTSVSGTFIDLQGAGGPSADANNLLYAGSDGGPYLAIGDLISSDAGNTVVSGTDGKLYVPAPGCCPTALDVELAGENGEHSVTLTLANGTTLVGFTAPRISADNPGLNDLRTGTDGGLYFDLSAQADYIALANKVLTAAAITGTTNKTLTLTFADGSTLTAPFTDIDTDTKYTFDITGNVITATGSDGSTQNITLPSGTVPDGSETKINVSTGLTIIGSGTVADPYVLTNTVADTDTNTTYALSLSGTNVTLTGSDGSTSTIALPTGTADTNTTYSFSISGTNLVINDSDGGSTNLPIPCSCDGSQTKVTAGTNIVVSGTGTTADPYVINSAASADGAETKINVGTGLSIVGTGTTADPYVLTNTVTDTNTTYALSISGTNVTLTGSDGSTSTIALPTGTADTNTTYTLAVSGTNLVLTGSDGAVTTLAIPCACDGSETKVTAGTGTTVTGSGTTASPYVINNTATADGSETKIEAGSMADVTGTGTTADPYIINSIVAKVTAGTNVTVTGDGTTANPYIINSTATGTTADGSETKINVGTGLSITGSGTTASPYVLTNTVVDTDTNTTYALSIAGTNVTLTGSDGSTSTIALPTGTADTNTTYTLAVSGTNLVLTGSDGAVTTLAIPCACDGSETKVSAGTNTTVTGSGTTASPYVINSTATADGSETKLNVGTGLTISGSGTTASPYLITNIVTDTNTTYTASISGNTITLTGSDGSTQNIALPTADGSETKLSGGTNVTITGAGTTASPYVISSTDVKPTAVSITGTDTKTLTMTLSDGSTVSGTFTDKDTDTTYTMSLSGSTLTFTPSSGTAQTVTLPTADGSETKVTGGANVTVSGDGTTASPYVVNSDDTFVTSVDVSGTSTKTVTIGLSDGTTVADTFTDNDTTYSVAVSGNDLTLTPSTGTAQTVTLPTADGSETKVTAGTGITVTGTGTTASPYVVGSKGGVLYKYATRITVNGTTEPPSENRMYDTIPGSVGAWQYVSCGLYRAPVSGYTFGRTNTMVMATTMTTYAGVTVAAEGDTNFLTLRLNNGSNYDPNHPCTSAIDLGVVYYEVTVFEPNPNP
jgi:hypothetical protein